MVTDPIVFSQNLVKGRIAETLFEQMLRDAGGYTVLSFGYENIVPELAHRQDDLQAKETMEIIRLAPDFAVIDNESHEVFLVEVKYMMNPRLEWILNDAKRMVHSWKPSYLFLCTPDGFYFDKAIDVEKNGKISPLLDQLKISTELREKYIKLLNEFIIVINQQPSDNDI